VRATRIAEPPLEQQAARMKRPWVSSTAYEAAVSFLIETRKAAGLSQRELADRLGKPRSFVSKIEGRERRLDVVEFVALARALDVNPGALMTTLASALPDDLDF
jgi:transcriptional regulator with XRE-family HTH domain